MTVFDRDVQQILDLDGARVAAGAEDGTASAAAPGARDEGRHPPGPEELWNES